MIETKKKPDGGVGRPRSVWALTGLLMFMVFWFCAFVALGNWQVRRREWKLDLIEKVTHRVHAPPVSPPIPDRQTGLNADIAYLHVRTTGHFLSSKETLTQAVSDFGPGYWVMTPFVSDAGFTVLVNRGFVDEAHAAAGSHSQPTGRVTVTGLLRETEPKGGFLQANDPVANKWHSRDVDAIARCRKIGPVAPYFIDADQTPNTGGFPIGGLTRINFPNNHLAYLLTWYGLAILVLCASGAVVRSEWSVRSTYKKDHEGE